MKRIRRFGSKQSPVYEARTRDIVVRVNPAFAPEHSDPDEGRWFWSYTIEIENHGGETMQPQLPVLLDHVRRGLLAGQEEIGSGSPADQGTHPGIGFAALVAEPEEPTWVWISNLPLTDLAHNWLSQGEIICLALPAEGVMTILLICEFSCRKTEILSLRLLKLSVSNKVLSGSLFSTLA